MKCWLSNAADISAFCLIGYGSQMQGSQYLGLFLLFWKMSLWPTSIFLHKWHLKCIFLFKSVMKLWWGQDTSTSILMCSFKTVLSLCREVLKKLREIILKIVIIFKKVRWQVTAEQWLFVYRGVWRLVLSAQNLYQNFHNYNNNFFEALILGFSALNLEGH